MRKWITLFENILVQEPSNDAYYDFHVAVSEHLDDLVSEYQTQRPRRWRTVRASTLTSVWESYIRLGFIRSEKAIDRIADVFYRNTVAIEVNNQISGHTQSSPEDVLADHMPAEEIEEFVEWAITFDDGWRISDYGTDKLVRLVCLFPSCNTPEEKLLVCDAILNVVHQRSDLASWFVEGGTRTLNALSSRPSEP